MHMHDLKLDQAAGLRKLENMPPVQAIAVASGKGGVGKTNISVNLATEMSARGRKVMLLDADFGLANVDVLLGLHPQYNLSHVIKGQRTLDEVILKAPRDVLVVPAASGVYEMATLSKRQHGGLIQAFSDLSHSVDTLIIDTAAGINDSVLLLVKASTDVLVVVCDEPASITDAYALIKVLSLDYSIRHFHVLSNMVHSSAHGERLFAKLMNVTDKFLDVSLSYFGAVPDDPYLRKAVQKQQPVVLAYPQSRAALEFKKLAGLADAWPVPVEAGGHLEFFFERLISSSSPQVRSAV